MRFTLALLLSLAVMSSSRAQQDETAKQIGNFLLRTTDDDFNHLPEPSRYNPAYLSFPDYAKTPIACAGDDTISDYLANRFPSRRGQVNFHVTSQGFLSVSLSRQDENVVDSVDLSVYDRDQLRTFLKLRINAIEETQTGRTWVFRLASIPGLATGEILVWFIYLGGEGSSFFVGSVADETIARLKSLADQLQSSTKLYRSVTTLKSSAGRQYVRYMYAVRPADREATILRTCFYARR
jgi:hypothetical protein